MNDITISNKTEIENMIYEIRGVQVMLDSDLAKLYGCKYGTKEINQAVRRNIDKFPDDFYFRLTKTESEFLRSQNVTLKKGRGQHIKYLPYAFTEQGVAMLATILKTSVASQISVSIMRAFVKMRHYLGNSEYRLSNIETKLIEHDTNIKLLQESFNKFEENREINEIYFDGKIYDAYSKVLDIFMSAKNELIIIDRYTDKTMLDMIKELKCKVVLITFKKSKITKLDIEKYNSTYNNLKIVYDDTFHDRYFIIDRDKIYHSGNSVNHIGFRKSSIDVLEDKSIKNCLINDIEKIINP